MPRVWVFVKKKVSLDQNLVEILTACLKVTTPGVVRGGIPLSILLSIEQRRDQLIKKESKKIPPYQYNGLP